MTVPVPSSTPVQASEHAPSGAEFRKAQRVPYRAIVLAAPYDGNRVPERDEFHEVRTRDLSPTGISFEADASPASRHLVLLFGQSELAPIYVVARVVHFTEYASPSRTLYVVGCELMERLHADANP